MDAVCGAINKTNAVSLPLLPAAVSSLRLPANQISEVRVLLDISRHKLAFGNDLQALFTRVL